MRRSFLLVTDIALRQALTAFAPGRLVSGAILFIGFYPVLTGAGTVIYKVFKTDEFIDYIAVNGMFHPAGSGFGFTFFHLKYLNHKVFKGFMTPFDFAGPRAGFAAGRVPAATSGR